MAVQKTLELDFLNQLNRTHRLRVYNAKDELVTPEIVAVMDEIIDKNIFSGSGGELTGKISARMVIRETTEFDLI
ncbi:MAG TPA: DUF2922 domain-containing protein [Syntrophomonadaceae bacterium]|nr:DUF2922 domain-containing protein [Syntrophomonadaceae bacterium]